MFELFHSFGRDRRLAVLSDVFCRRNRLVIHQCNFSDVVSLSCTDDESDVSVTCCKPTY